MKTIDEVIEYFNNQCQMRHVYLTEDADARFAEALHYLKDYRMLISDFEAKRKELEAEKDRYAEAVRNCEQAENNFRKMEDELNDIRREHIEQMKNPPLSWDELRTMEGKPVWIEPANEWILISFAEENRIFFIERTWTCNEHSFPEEEYPERWQAYRKERTDVQS